MSDNKQENEKRETVADIVADMRKRCTPYAKSDSADCRYVAYLGYKEFADRIEAAWKRERDRLMSEPRSFDKSIEHAMIERAMKVKENSDVLY